MRENQHKYMWERMTTNTSEWESAQIYVRDDQLNNIFKKGKSAPMKEYQNHHRPLFVLHTVKIPITGKLWLSDHKPPPPIVSQNLPHYSFYKKNPPPVVSQNPPPPVVSKTYHPLGFGVHVFMSSIQWCVKYYTL